MGSYRDMELSTIIVIIGSIIVYQSHRQRKKIAWFSEKVDLAGKVALVTGSSSGLGFSTALYLAKMRAKVVLLSRNDNNSKEKIVSMSGNKDIHSIPLDLGNLGDVRAKSAEISGTFPEGVDLLINCAGTAFGPVENSNDGIDYTYQVNHFGPQLLVEKLMPLLEKKSGRIVNVGSKQANRFSKMSLDGFSRAKIQKSFFERLKVYMQSKVFNTTYTLALAEELTAKNCKVTVNIAFPGLTQTNICSKASLLAQLIWMAAGFIFFKYPVEGAQSVIYCALSAELKGISGKMISECREVDNLVPDQLTDPDFCQNFLSKTRDLLYKKIK